MKRSTLIAASAIVAALVVVTSCKKDDEPSKTDLLTGKSWYETKSEISYKGVKTSVPVDDCEKDDILKFVKEGTYNATIGADDCDGGESTETGKWSWQNGEKTLRLINNADVDHPTDVTLISLTSSTIVVNTGAIEFDVDGDGKDDTNVDLLVTYTAK